MTASWQKVLLFAAAFLLFAWGTWQLPLLGPDEPRYAQVAREMFESGDYFVPKLGGFAWFEKPILLYWLMCFSYALFGVNEFAARLPSAMAAIGSVAFLYFTLRKITNERTALLSSATLATSAFFVAFSHAATFDMLLTFCVTAALCSFLIYESSERNSWLYWMYGLMGLGILAKGFVAPIIIAVSLIGYLLVSKNLKQILKMKIWQGALLVAAVTALWFLPVSLIYGIRFWDEFVYQHHFVRYTSSYYHRSQGFFFYLPVLIAGTYPWSFAPFSSRLSNSPLTRFALCWLFCPLIFFSFSQSKLPGYILSAVPAFAILAGLALSNLQKPLRLVALLACLNIALLGLSFWATRKYAIPAIALYSSLGAITILMGISALLVHYRRWTGAFITYALILVAGMMIFVLFIFPQFHWSDSKNLSLAWVRQTPANRKLVPYNLYDFAPVFYTNGRVELDPQGYTEILTNASQLHRYLMKRGEAHVQVANEELEWMIRADFWKVQSVLKGEHISIVELHPK